MLNIPDLDDKMMDEMMGEMKDEMMEENYDEYLVVYFNYHNCCSTSNDK